MRLLILATLFLISSDACASPVYIAARGNSHRTPKPPLPKKEDPFAGVSKADLLKIFRKGESVASAERDRLVKVTYDGKDYQILSFDLIQNGPPRNFNKETLRFQAKKILLSSKQIPAEGSENRYYFFIFPANTFIPKVPNVMDFKALQQEAGEVYDRWEEIQEKDKGAFDFIYDKEKNPTIAVYMPGLLQRTDTATSRDLRGFGGQ